MAYPFFSLAKSKRLAPIDFKAGAVAIRVEAVPEHGMATIWDADVLIWAASQIVEARDHGLRTSRLMAATPYEILTFVGRGTSARDYERLKAALDRLQATSVATSIRQPTERRRHRFSWINEWKERGMIAANVRTRVELLHLEGRIERWIRFGRVAHEDVLDRRRRALWFAADSIFAFVRWASGEHGTLVSRIDILRACAADEPVTTVPGVTPGGEVLLRVQGWPKVERVLAAIDQVEALGVPAEDACPDHWRHIHNRLAVAEAPRAYTRQRHAAWLSRRRIGA